MPLTEEQKLIEEKIQLFGYNHKFLAQLHAVKIDLNQRILLLTDSKETFEDHKVSWSKEYKEQHFLNVDIPKTELDGQETVNSTDDDGNIIYLTDSEIDDRVETYFNADLESFDLKLSDVNESLDLVNSEINFRNEGLVIRDPKGTTYYVSYDGNNADSTVHTTAWRYGYLFTNAGRSPGDVCIFRRVRGGFNPSENVFINNYCRRMLTSVGLDPNLTESFTDIRSPGFVSGTGQISAFGSTDYGGDDDVVSDMISSQNIKLPDGLTAIPTGANKNLSGTTTAYNSGYIPIGNMSMETNGVRLPRSWWIDLIDPNSPNYEEGAYYGDNNWTNDNSMTSYSTYDDFTPTYNNQSNEVTLNTSWGSLFTGSYFKSGRRITNPRDKSRWLHINLREYDMHYRDNASGISHMSPQSNGTDVNPIMMIADYENKWGDFLDTGGMNGNDSNGSDGDSTQYKVEVGSKIIRRQTSIGEPVEVHSYITPGDWIFVGQLDPITDPPKVNATYSDDPYEFSYCVRDVNYDKIVLWHPYKGEQAGIEKRLVSMGYAPRLGSISPIGNNWSGINGDVTSTWEGSHLLSYHVKNWFVQGLEFMQCFRSFDQNTGEYNPRTRSTAVFSGHSSWKFKDCNFVGSETHADWHVKTFSTVVDRWKKRTSETCIRAYHDGNDLEFDKCIMVNSRFAFTEGMEGDQHDSGSEFKFRDVVFNGSLLDHNFANQIYGSDSKSWESYSSSHPTHKWPEFAFYIKKGSSSYDIEECEFVNYRRGFFFKQPKTVLKLRANKFLGLGLDFVDPTVDNDADAQENLGLRYSRACFAGIEGIHPTTPSWKYGMLYPAMDSKGIWSSQGNSAPTSNEGFLKKIDIVNSSDYQLFGKFLGGVANDNTGNVNKGHEWFIYSSVDDLITLPDADVGENIGTETSSFGVGKHARRARATDGVTDHDWRDNLNANSGNAWGYSMQPDSSSAGINHTEIIDANDNKDQSWVTDKQGWNDNQYPWYDSMFHGDNSKYINWDQYKFYNGALAIMGGKGFSDSGQMVWDWDKNWRSGDGGSTVMRASDGYLRFPYVYGGVRIPPSICECVSRFMAWHNNFTSPMYVPLETTGDAVTTHWSRNPSRNNHPMIWFNRMGRELLQTHQNSTLAPSISTGVTFNNSFDATYNENTGATVFDYKLSNGPGFGIGSAPHLGVMHSFDIQNSGGNMNNSGTHHKSVDQNRKTTSQDHYQMFLNYDFDQFKDGGYLVDSGSDFDFAIDRPLVTGVDGIGKGIIYEQGRFRQSDPFYNTATDSEWQTPSTAGQENYGTNSGNVDPNYRVYQYANVPLMETIVDSEKIDSGGGNYLIKVFPTDQIGGGLTQPSPFANDRFTDEISDNFTRDWARQSALLIFEYPFYLSTNSRTYTVKLRPDEGDGSSRFKFSANPTGSQCWLEMEFWQSTPATARLAQVRKIKKSNSETEFGVDQWQSLSLTVTPKTEGVGYLRLYWGKPREANKVNTFYVDPKVVVY